jgi:hypothetical protein
MRLYKLLPKKYALKSMRERRCKVSRLSQLNDPFETFPVDLSRAPVRVALSETMRKLDEKAGLMCFSKDWSNPVIWAHYADEHRGVCLGFDIPDELAGEITYSATPIPLPDIEALSESERLGVVNHILFTKFQDWQYEHEYRVSVRLDWTTYENGLFFKEWGDDFKLAEVILGLRCETCRRELEQALEGYAEPVTFIHARVAYNSFSLVRYDHDEVRSHDELVYCLQRGNAIHPVHFYR